MTFWAAPLSQRGKETALWKESQESFVRSSTWPSFFSPWPRQLWAAIRKQKTQNKIRRKKALPNWFHSIQLDLFCRFHTYYSITTRYLINSSKISSVIILLSNRTLSARKHPIYKAFQKFLIIQTPLRTAFHDTQRLLLEVYISNVRSVFVFFAPLMKK